MSDGSPGKTAFVFAGGGSFGAIQVGMLRELVAHGVTADFVVGSSVGALNGAYFAGDPTAEGVARLENIWCGLRREDVFPLTLRGVVGLLFSAASLVDSRGLRDLIERHLPYRALENALLPIYVMATDVLNGAAVQFSSGPAVEAILASCAIPAAFPPVRIGKDYLVDGAIANNTPVVTAVELGASRIVVLPTGFACSRSGTAVRSSRRVHGSAPVPDRGLAIRLLARSRADRPVCGNHTKLVAGRRAGATAHPRRLAPAR
jgi:NTE family protein